LRPGSTFLLCVVLLARFSGVERSSLAFASNALLLYTLGSAVWLLPVALIGRRLDTWLTLAGCFAIGSVLWGGLFIPKQSQESAQGPSVLPPHCFGPPRFVARSGVRVWPHISWYPNYPGYAPGDLRHPGAQVADSHRLHLPLPRSIREHGSNHSIRWRQRPSSRHGHAQVPLARRAQSAPT